MSWNANGNHRPTILSSSRTACDLGSVFNLNAELLHSGINLQSPNSAFDPHTGHSFGESVIDWQSEQTRARIRGMKVISASSPQIERRHSTKLQDIQRRQLAGSINLWHHPLILNLNASSNNHDQSWMEVSCDSLSCGFTSRPAPILRISSRLSGEHTRLQLY